MFFRCPKLVRNWENLKLPDLTPETPWYGYSLGEWPKELGEEAERAVEGDYWITGERQAQRRRSDVTMNTDVSEVDEAKVSD